LEEEEEDFAFVTFYLEGRKTQNLCGLWELSEEVWKITAFTQSRCSCHFFCCQWKTHNFLQGILMCPGSPHHCERQRHRERDTHTHTSSDFARHFHGWGNSTLLWEREILEFCIEELELDCKM
jgi:hypothetical protein